MAQPGTVTVHLLSVGVALCGKMGYPQASWPPGHVSKSLIDYRANPDASLGRNQRYCRECLEAAAGYMGEPRK